MSKSKELSPSAKQAQQAAESVLRHLSDEQLEALRNATDIASTTSESTLERTRQIHAIAEAELSQQQSKDWNHILDVPLKDPESELHLATAAHVESLNELMLDMLDIQEKILEGSEQDRKLSEQRYVESLETARRERKVAEQRYAENVKFEKRSFLIGFISAAFAGIAAFNLPLSFDNLSFVVIRTVLTLLKLCLL